MKKRLTTGLLLCLFAAAMVCFAAGCGQEEKPDPVVHPITITISVDYPKSAEPEDITEEEFTIEEGSTVLEALQLYCYVNDMPLIVETTGGTVLGINGVENHGEKGRGWRYELNGSLCAVSENEQRLADGDQIKWMYQKEK